MLQFICKQAQAVGFEGSFASKIELAAEEALVNIIHYGYPEKKGNISIKCLPLDQGIRIQIQDKGIAFDPTDHAKTITFNTEAIGGHGILFILKCMDEVQYEEKMRTMCSRW